MTIDSNRIFTGTNLKLKIISDVYIYIYIHEYKLHKFALWLEYLVNGPGDLGSILGRVMPNTLKMVLDGMLLNTQHYKVRSKGKVEQSRERNRAPYPLV